MTVRVRAKVSEWVFVLALVSGLELGTGLGFQVTRVSEVIV